MTPIAKIVENLELPSRKNISQDLRNQSKQFESWDSNPWFRGSITSLVFLALYMIIVFVIHPKVFEFSWMICGLLILVSFVFGGFGIFERWRSVSVEQNFDEENEEEFSVLNALQEEIDSFNEAVYSFNTKVKDFASKPDYSLESLYDSCQSFLENRREYLIDTISVFRRKNYDEVSARLEAYHDFVDYFEELL